MVTSLHFETAPAQDREADPKTSEALLCGFDRLRGRQRLIIMDAALMSKAGHHFSHDRALVEAAGRANIPNLVFGFEKCLPEVTRGIPMVPHFGIQPYFKPFLHTSAEEDFATLNEAFLHCLANIPLEVTGRDVVVFPTVTQNQLLAIAAWMVKCATRRGCPRVVIGLMFAPDWLSITQRDSSQFDLYRRAFKSWPRLVRDRARLVCETMGHARVYQDLSGLPVKVLPAPTVSRFHRVPSVAPAHSAAEQFVVGYLGHARREKGVQHLADVANIAMMMNANVRFRVQLNYPQEYPLLREAKSRLIASDAVLPLTMGSMDEEAYARFIDACHLILLPYDPERYRSRGSGLIREALYRGRPVVVPRYTEMGAWVHREGIGVGFDEFNPSSIAAAVVAASEGYRDLARKAFMIGEGLEPEREADQYLEFLMSEREA